MANIQTSPNFVKGQVPTAAQWNGYFAGKLDALVGVTLTVSAATNVAATVAKMIVDTTGGDVIIEYSPTLGQPGKENRVRFVKKSVTPNANKVYLTTDGTMLTNFATLVSENDLGGAGWLDVDVDGTSVTTICGLP